MANHADLVALGIPEIGAVVVGVVLRPQPRSAFVRTAIQQGCCMSSVDLLPGACEEGKHLTIARLVRLSVERRRDHEEWPGFRGRLPSCPGAAPVDKALLYPQCVQNCAIEAQRTLEVCNAGDDV